MPDRTGYVAEAITEKHREAVRRSRQLLASGKEFRRSRETLWRQSQDQYNGDHWKTTEVEDPTADLITINVSFSTVNTIIPYVTSEEPQFLVEPYSSSASAINARLQQAMLNRQWRVSGGKPATRAAAEDYLIYGDGYMKASWAIVNKLGESGNQTEVVDIFVDPVSPWDVWLDPFSTGMSDARWVCQRLSLTRREFEKDDRFDQSFIDELPWGRWEVDGEERGDRNEDAESSSEAWVHLYEFYDRTDRELYVFTESGTEQPLRVVEEIDCPIFSLPNYRIPDSPYHMGELEQLWPMQQELNKTRSQLITHRRRNIGKYFYRSGTLSEDGLAALASPIVNQAVEVLGDVPLDNVVRPAQLSPLAPENYASADTAMRDMYEISGVNEYLRGATPEISRTATEASIIEGASNVKTRAKLADVESCVRDVAEYMLAIMKEVYPETDVDEMAMYLTGSEAEQIGRMQAASDADIAAEEGAPVYEIDDIFEQGQSIEGLTVTPSDDVFIGVYRVEVMSGSTEMRNPLFKEQKYRDMATTLINFSPALTEQGVTLNLRKVLEMWFEAAGVQDVEGMFEAAPQMGVPALAGDAAGVPPELAAMLQGGGASAAGGPDPREGQPNVAAARPPLNPLTSENTGAFAPAL